MYLYLFLYVVCNVVGWFLFGFHMVVVLVLDFLASCQFLCGCVLGGFWLGWFLRGCCFRIVSIQINGHADMRRHGIMDSWTHGQT